jgi:hypothetical protein
MKTKHIWVGYMIKFVICATWVSKSFHQKHYTHIVKMASQAEKAKFMLWFHESKSAVAV